MELEKVSDSYEIWACLHEMSFQVYLVLRFTIVLNVVHRQYLYGVRVKSTFGAHLSMMFTPNLLGEAQGWNMKP